MIANCSPKIIGSKLGSPFGLRPRSGLGSGSARARNYSALFGLGSAQGSARASSSGLDLGFDPYRLGLAQTGWATQLCSGSAWLEGLLGSDQFCPRFGTCCLAGSLTRLTLINLAWDSAQLSSEFGSVQIEAQFVSVDSVLGSGSAPSLLSSKSSTYPTADCNSETGSWKPRLRAWPLTSAVCSVVSCPRTSSGHQTSSARHRWRPSAEPPTAASQTQPCTLASVRPLLIVSARVLRQGLLEEFRVVWLIYRIRKLGSLWIKQCVLFIDRLIFSILAINVTFSFGPGISIWYGKNADIFRGHSPIFHAPQ